MSTLAAKALAISSLFVRNVYRQIWPNITQRQGVFYARCTIVAVITLGAIAAWLMGNFLSIINLVLTVNIPFGAAVLLTFFWRRTTAPAVWSCVLLTALVVLVIPWTASKIPGVRDRLSLTMLGSKPAGAPAPVYFDKVVRARPSDPASPLVAAGGLNRFDLECWLIGKAGVDVAAMSPISRFTAQFFFDGLFPFVVLIVASLLTRPTHPELVDQFYGKMKTPVGDTPELEQAAMAETQRNPRRFEHTKLFPNSNWEFCKWDRVDALGFVICCLVTVFITGLFLYLLKLASGR
jgi:hypothetical protein